MRASLPDREPAQVAKWLSEHTFQKLVEKNRSAGGASFLLHDGPPYANGGIHIGHALNKVLKDVVIKYKNLRGLSAPFVPGWDCHGLPIELGVEKQLLEQKRDKATVPVTELRQMCRAYARQWVETQKGQFQRLEVFADWDHPYLTLEDSYVASIVRELGRCSEKGVLYKGNKPVYWCASCATALAEAEIEYADKKSPSIYVKFDLTRDALKAFPELKAAADEAGAARVCVIIWTTTPWTLPANLGIALNPEFDYVAVPAPTLEGTELWIVADGLKEAVQKAAGFEKPSTPVLTFKADKLHRQKARHPFIERDSLILLGDHVTLEAGTGAVHTAPGHGVDDYRVGSKYGLEIFAPVDARGKYTADFAPMQGQFIFKANEPIIALLQESGHLLARQDITHSYPHCWRCHSPVLFRATPQWFIGMERESLRARALEQIGQVEWIPAWGINRIQSMVENRPDWCISRQRMWGVPITVFYCASCETPKADRATFEHVASVIETRGVDAWFTDDATAFLPAGAACAQCKGTQFTKEKDILDVWFDSGVSHAAVLDARKMGWPADLYLEGSDQHRGWFQTSLLTAVATRGQAPFKKVLTHGFVNDKDGKKMSKSKGNVTSPLDLMKTNGAEILRLWVCLEDYRNDVSFSKESLDRVSESYRKIRNTLRFALGNLFDFNPDTDARALAQLGDLDRWALSRAAEALGKIQEAYERYEFHQVYHLLVNFIGVELSAVYFDILKDRLYTAGKASAERRSSQTALFWITRALAQTIAPILSFTAEELWSFLPQWNGKAGSVFLGGWPSLQEWRAPELESAFAQVFSAREVVQKRLEEARQAKVLGHAREARVALTVDAPTAAAIAQLSRSRGDVLAEDPKRLFLVSELSIREGAEIAAEISRAPGDKCARCWTFDTAVGKSAAHPDLCARCDDAIA